MFNFISVACNYNQDRKKFGQDYLGFLIIAYLGFSIAGIWGTSRVAHAGWDDRNMRIAKIRKPLPARRSSCT
jgi:hypothetical protein